jgi:NAD-dependent DNA ligase
MILDKSLVDYSTGEPFEIEPPLECSITNSSVMQIQSGYQVLCRGMLNQKNLTTQNICHFFAENLELLSSMVVDDSDIRSQFSDCDEWFRRWATIFVE